MEGKGVLSDMNQLDINKIKRFYRRLKAFLIGANCYLVVCYGLVTGFNIHEGNWLTAFLPWLAWLFIIPVETFLFVYYRNIVVDVSFDPKGDVAIQTNCREWKFPVSAIKKIEVSRSLARTFITCQTGPKTKVFIFQMKYSPFKTYSLNVENLRENLPETVFIES